MATQRGDDEDGAEDGEAGDEVVRRGAAHGRDAWRESWRLEAGALDADGLACSC